MTHPDQPEKKEYGGTMRGGPGMCSCGEDSPIRLVVHRKEGPCFLRHTSQPSEPDRPADANKTMGEGPFVAGELWGIPGVGLSCTKEWSKNSSWLVTTTKETPSKTALENAHLRAAQLNEQLFSWLKENGWAKKDCGGECTLQSNSENFCNKHLREFNAFHLSSLSQERGELKAEVKEWICVACNTIYPGPPVKGAGCVMCPRCNGDCGPRLFMENRALKKERDEMKEKAEGLAHALTVILPMAKGYAFDNQVGRNREMVDHAEKALAAYAKAEKEKEGT